MKFLNQGDLVFSDLECLMFEGGLKRAGHQRKRRKVLSTSHQISGSAAVAGPTAQLESGGTRAHSAREPNSGKFELTAVVQNIPKSATREDVHRYFTDRCGQVVDVKFVPGKSNIACVQFAQASAMEKAVSGLANPTINGVEVRVRPSQEIRDEMAQKPQKRSDFSARPGQGFHTVTSAPIAGASTVNSRKIRASKLPRRITQAQVRNIFDRYGDIESLDLKPEHSTAGKLSYQYCDIVYRTAKSAMEAAATTDGYMLAGEHLQVHQATDAPPPPPVK